MSQAELYAEIKSFYPHWLTQIREFDAIFLAQSKLLEKCEQFIKQTEDDCTISKCSEYRLKELLDFFRLNSPLITSTESARLLVKSCFSRSKINEQQIKQIVFDFLNVDCSVSLNNMVLTVNIIADSVDTSNLRLCIQELQNQLNCGVEVMVTTTAVIKTTVYTGILVSEYRKETME